MISDGGGNDINLLASRPKGRLEKLGLGLAFLRPVLFHLRRDAPALAWAGLGIMRFFLTAATLNFAAPCAHPIP